MAMEQRVARATGERYIFIEELCALWGFLSSTTVEMDRVAGPSDQYIANTVDLSTRYSMLHVPMRLPSKPNEVGSCYKECVYLVPAMAWYDDCRQQSLIAPTCNNQVDALCNFSDPGQQSSRIASCSAEPCKS